MSTTKRISMFLGALSICCVTGILPALALDAKAGPIWNNDDAKVKCPAACAAIGGKWNGQWTTTVQGKESVCGCV